MAELKTPTWEFANDPESGMSVLITPGLDDFNVWFDLPEPCEPSREPDCFVDPVPANDLRELALNLLERLDNRRANGHKHPLDPSFDPDLRMENLK